MGLESYVRSAWKNGASDLHLQPGLPAAIRIAGKLNKAGEALAPATLRTLAKEFLGPADWKQFVARKSADVARSIGGVRCRVNVLRSSRGVGFAIRLLSGTVPTLGSLNLHPSLKELTTLESGLVIISGPTGCGKSSTLAALINEVNHASSTHILTIERPIEYVIPSQLGFVRQREVGRDTPSFHQAVHDALREDPDLLMVGEMRQPETIRGTLTAAEAGHSVFTTLHSTNCQEALQRVVKAFAPEIQHSIRAQLASTLQAVVAQRLVYREDLGFRIPVLEVLRVTTPVRSLIRSDQFFKIGNLMETGQAEGQFTVKRYEDWARTKHDWIAPDAERSAAPVEEFEIEEEPEPMIADDDAPPAAKETSVRERKPETQRGSEDVIVIDPPSGSISDILDELDD